MTKEENKVEQINTASAEKDMDTKENSGYSVIIEGEEIEVDVNIDEEYSCLLNCLEGYYIYGIGREGEDESQEEYTGED